MQLKRRQILDLLQEQGSATVEEMGQLLGITTVTVRHHLEVLRQENLITAPVIRQRNTPGRPQFEYRLTPQGAALFTRRYAELANALLDELRLRFPKETVNDILTSVGERLLNLDFAEKNTQSLPDRLRQAVAHLNEIGFVAQSSESEAGITIFTHNCPYNELAEHNPELCAMDHGLLQEMLGVPAERICSKAHGDSACGYLISLDSIQSTSMES